MRRQFAIVMVICLVIPACRKASPTGATGAAAGNPTVGGATQAVRGAVIRTVNLNTLKNLQTFIENASGGGRMPSVAQIKEAAKQDRELLSDIEEGRIVLTGTTNREGVWAYAAEAMNTRGYVVTSSGIEQMSAAELRQRLQGGG